VQTEDDVSAVTGEGSQLHRMYLRFTAVNTSLPIYLLAVAESDGAQASGSVLVTGTATSAGNIRFWCGDAFVDTGVNVGDTPTEIAANLVVSINDQVDWPITATSSSGVVTLTAKNHGPEGNWIKVQVLAGPTFAPASVTVSISGVAWAADEDLTSGQFNTPSVPNGYYYKLTTLGDPAETDAQPTWPTTLGETTEADGNGNVWTCWGTLSGAGIASLGGGATADNYTDALATIDPVRYRYIVLADSDATNVGRAVAQAQAQAEPATGIRQQVFYGSVDTLANAITVATTINSPQSEMQWGNATDITPLELAANNAAIYSLYENSGNTGARYVGRLNFSLFPTTNPQYDDSDVWFIEGSRNGPAAGPTTAQITSCLNNGITPIALLADGTAQIVKRVTNRSLNGSNNDYRIRDAHKVSIMFAWADQAVYVTQQQFGGKDLLDPPKAGGAALPPQATDTVLWGNALKDLTTQMGNAGLLQNTDTTNDAAIIQRETDPSTRMSALFNLQTADIFDQGCIVAQQVG